MRLGCCFVLLGLALALLWPSLPFSCSAAPNAHIQRCKSSNIHKLSYSGAAGGPETEEAICAAGGVPALLSLIRSCIEEPEQATLLEPATVALLNLAAGSDAHKEAIVEADALSVLVKLLTHQVR
jgi:hypothetical protein